MNLAEIICRRHVDAIFRIALEEMRCAGANTYTFGGLDYLSDKFATVLNNCGIKPSDVVAVLLPPSAAFVVAHLAILKLGAVVAPINPLLEKSSLAQVLNEDLCQALIIDESLGNEMKVFLQESNNLPIFVASDYVSKNDFGAGLKSFWYEINFAESDFKTAETIATTPAYIFFEQDESSHFTSKSFTHGFILEMLQGIEKRCDVAFEKTVNLPVQIADDWSDKSLLIESLYASLFVGHCVQASAPKQ